MAKANQRDTGARSIFASSVVSLRGKVLLGPRKVRRAKRFSPLCLFAFVFLPALASPSQSTVESRIDALIARMTLEEKLGQLQQLDGEANGNYRPEHLDLVRRGLLGSTLNVRGARKTN